MIGIDSNILVRHFVQDDPVQSPKATEMIERGFTVDEPGFVSIIAMAETVWVLKRTYRFADEEIAMAIQSALEAEALVIENAPEVFIAMEALREGRGSFADALIAALGTKAGWSHTVTFDRRALRIDGFAPL